MRTIHLSLLIAASLSSTLISGEEFSFVAESTTISPTTTTTVRLPTAGCPPGFVLYEAARKCYALSIYKGTWAYQYQQCWFKAPGAHMAAPLNPGEDEFIQSLISSSPERGSCECLENTSRYYCYYLGGHTCDPGSCSRMGWQMSTDTMREMHYKNFPGGEPSCVNNTNFCVHYYYNMNWHKSKCTTSMCGVCEVPASISTEISSGEEKTALVAVEEPKKACPIGFTLYEPSNKCYALTTYKAIWGDQFRQCTILATGAHLGAPLNAGENDFIKNLISNSPDRTRCECPSGDTTYYCYYLAGHTCDPGKCSRVGWQLNVDLMQEIHYTDFIDGTPNCASNNEFCVHYHTDMKWNDIYCNTQMCGVCEYRL